MLEALITSKTRLKLVLKFFMNPEANSYLRGLAEEFGESSNAIRVELNRFESAGLLRSHSSGNKKMFCANTDHPLYDEIHNIVKKTFGIDKIVDEVIERLGDVKEAYLIGGFAAGKNSDTMEILLVGEVIKEEYLRELIKKAEKLIKRKIKYLLLDPKETQEYLPKQEHKMLIWEISRK